MRGNMFMLYGLKPTIIWRMGNCCVSLMRYIFLLIGIMGIMLMVGRGVVFLAYSKYLMRIGMMMTIDKMMIPAKIAAANTTNLLKSVRT